MSLIHLTPLTSTLPELGKNDLPQQVLEDRGVSHVLILSQMSQDVVILEDYCLFELYSESS